MFGKILCVLAVQNPVSETSGQFYENTEDDGRIDSRPLFVCFVVVSSRQNDYPRMTMKTSIAFSLGARAARAEDSSGENPFCGRRSQTNRWLCLFTFALGLGSAQAGFADLLSEFSQEYPAAAARLEEAYRHARVLAKETRTDSRGGAMVTEAVEFLREGDRIRGKKTVLESAAPQWPEGAIRIFGGGEADFFDVSKLPTQSEFQINSFGPDKDFRLRSHLICQPLFAAYCFRDTRIVDYLAQDGRRVVSATMTKLDGEDVVDVTAEVVIPDVGTFRDHLFFVPGTWALAGWTIPVQPVSQGRITYESDTTPPKIRKVDTWFDGETPDQKMYRCLSEVSSVEFGPILAKEFTLEGIGLKTPVPPGVLPDRPAGVEGIEGSSASVP